VALLVFFWTSNTELESLAARSIVHSNNIPRPADRSLVSVRNKETKPLKKLFNPIHLQKKTNHTIQTGRASEMNHSPGRVAPIRTYFVLKVFSNPAHSCFRPVTCSTSPSSHFYRCRAACLLPSHSQPPLLESSRLLRPWPPKRRRRPSPR
jgi:hypothetical protein